MPLNLHADGHPELLLLYRLWYDLAETAVYLLQSRLAFVNQPGLMKIRRVMVGLALLVATTGTAGAQQTPFCPSGQLPTFVPELVDLNNQIGGLLGDPLECLHPDPLSGDMVQQTTNGLAILQAATNLPGFVSGEEHWQLTPDGVVYWTEPGVPPPPNADQSAITDAVVADAAQRAHVDPSRVQVLRWQHVDWPDSSLGCPQPGAAYAQVIIPGWRIVVQADGQTFEYHTDEHTRFVFCLTPGPRLPPID